jgi:hypothetical protein
LIMRRAGDRRPARIAKPELLRSYASSGRTIGVVVDDDLQVCEALERDGWPVLCADWMGRAETLEQAQEDAGLT